MFRIEVLDERSLGIEIIFLRLEGGIEYVKSSYIVKAIMLNDFMNL